VNLRPTRCDEIVRAVITDLTTVEIRRCRVLGALINEYEQAALRSG
jgi:hypothetical protein